VKAFPLKSKKYINTAAVQIVGHLKIGNFQKVPVVAETYSMVLLWVSKKWEFLESGTKKGVRNLVPLSGLLLYSGVNGFSLKRKYVSCPRVKAFPFQNAIFWTRSIWSRARAKGFQFQNKTQDSGVKAFPFQSKKKLYIFEGKAFPFQSKYVPRQVKAFPNPSKSFPVPEQICSTSSESFPVLEQNKHNVLSFPVTEQKKMS